MLRYIPHELLFVFCSEKTRLLANPALKAARAKLRFPPDVRPDFLVANGQRMTPLLCLPFLHAPGFNFAQAFSGGRPADASPQEYSEPLSERGREGRFARVEKLDSMTDCMKCIGQRCLCCLCESQRYAVAQLINYSS
jgi:hypothetical protein